MLTQRFSRPRRRVQPLLERLEDRCVPATTRTWIGDVNEVHWNVAGNWKDSNNAPGVPQSGDILIFPPAAQVNSQLSTNDLPADTSFDFMLIQGSGYSIGGNRIQLLAATEAPLIASNSTGQNVLTLDINFGGSGISRGAIDVYNAAATLRLDGHIGGSVGLTKRQAGMLILRADNSYTGVTDIQGGIVRKTTPANAIPNASEVIVAAGATLDLNDTDETFDKLSGSGTVSTGGNGGHFLAIGWANGSSTFNGQITGSGDLYKVGTGAISLAGSSNPISGTTRVTQGILALATTGADNTALGGPVEVGDSFGAAGDAVLRLDRNHALPDDKSVLVRGDGTFNVNSHAEFVGALTINRDPQAAGAVDVGTGTLGVNGLLTCNGGNILGTGAGAITPLADVLFTAASGGASTVVARLELAGRTQIFAVEDLGGVVSDFTLAGSISGSQGLTKTGPGTLVMVAANGFTGRTTVAEGTLFLANGGNSTIIGPLNVGDGGGASATVLLADSNEIADNVTVTVKSDGLFDISGLQETTGLLSVQSGAVSIGTGSLTVNGPLSMTGGTISSTGSGRLVMNGNAVIPASSTTATINGHVHLNGGTRSFNVEDGTQFDDLVINGFISNGGFIKNGLGYLRFQGASANTYTGPTAVNDGWLILAKPAGVTAIAGPIVVGDNFGGVGGLQVDSNEQIANTSDVIIQPDGRLQLAFGSETIHALSMTGGLVNIFNQRVLTLDGDVTYNGMVSGATIGLVGFPGPAGQLSLGSASRTFTVADGAAAVDLNIALPIVGNPGIGLTKAGPGAMTVNNAVVLSGPSTLAAGTLRVNDLFAGPLTVNQGATLTGAGSLAAVTMQGESRLSPGNSVGLLGTGNLALGDDARVIIEIQNSAPVADVVDARGAVNLGIRAKLDVVPLNAINLAVGTKLTIILNDGADPILGAFANLPEGAVVNSRYRISYKGGDGNDVELTRIASYIVTGTDVGIASRVRVFDVAAPHAAKFDFLAYPAAFKGGVRVAAADINGDGYPDIITAPGPGIVAAVKVFSGNTAPGQTPALLLPPIKPYGNAYKGGAFLATGDVNGDGVPDIVVGPGAGIAPTIKIFSGANGILIGLFSAFGSSFHGGVTVSAADVNADGRLDIVAGMGAGNKPRVRVFDAASRTQLPGLIGNFLAYGPGFTGGVFVASGDLNGDGVAEIITGPGAGLAPVLKIFDQNHMTMPRALLAYPATMKKGVRVALGDVNGDGKAEILAALGPGGNTQMRIFNGLTLQALDSFFAGVGAKGLFIAGSR